MNWTTATDLRAQVQRLWDRGELLRAAVTQDMPWPLRLALKSPNAAELSERFDAVREWVQALTETPHVRIEWREWKHRVQGTQRVPAAVWIDSLPQALACIGKTREAQRFEALWHQTASAQPVLLAWLSRRPLQALELADRWQRLLAVVAWLQARPRPGVYLRQVDAPGVDSKFIEAHRGVLTELLDLALPPEAIDADATGAAQFARRYGFLDKPVRIRLRWLDVATPSLPGCEGLPDVTLDATSFATLALPIDQVFITENETNFLAFPRVERAVVVSRAKLAYDRVTNGQGGMPAFNTSLSDQQRADVAAYVSSVAGQ